MSQQHVLDLDTATRRVVELACRAPSVHNTQPWAWRIRPDHIELHADWSRRLPATDPDGRNLLISCGAALHHATIAATALGYHVTTTRTPHQVLPHPLATLHLTPAEPDPDALTDLAALQRRTTDRQRFTDWPIPDDRLHKAARTITQHGVRGLALTDVTDRFRVELLVARALVHQRTDDRITTEQHQWLDHSPTDGIPTHAIPHPDTDPSPGNLRSRFTDHPDDPTTAPTDDVRIGSDGLILLATDTDDRPAWLHAGEALSALWLHATTDGLSLVPLSQVIEVEETRTALRTDVLAGTLAGTAYPQILVRVGWQPLGRGARPPTPRRPLDDVILP